jgi:hypothetical protein
MVKNSDLRFMDYLSLQRFAPSTKEAYFGAVKGLADYYSTRQPDILSNEQIQDYGSVKYFSHIQCMWSQLVLLFNKNFFPNFSISG